MLRVRSALSISVRKIIEQLFFDSFCGGIAVRVGSPKLIIGAALEAIVSNAAPIVGLPFQWQPALDPAGASLLFL